MKIEKSRQPRMTQTPETIRESFWIDPRSGRGWLIETLGALQHDPNRPEDMLKVDEDEDGNGGDATDTLRYLVATKAREEVVRKLRWLSGKGLL